MSRYVKACSRTVGDVFKRRHDNVLMDIREAIETIEQLDKESESLGDPKFGLANFIESTYRDDRKTMT